MTSPRSAKAQRERVLSEVLLRGDPAGWLGWDPEPFDAGLLEHVVDELPRTVHRA